MGKDAISKSIRGVRKDFVKKRAPRAKELLIKPHSGRRHSISMMIKMGVPEVLGMKFANIKDRKTYYG